MSAGVTARMESRPAHVALPPIPAKRYFTIGEVSDLCAVKPHVLRYWEQEFTQLRPMKRRGNRRYYQHHEVLLIRKIRELLYEQGFTISGARNQLMDGRALSVSALPSSAAPTTPVFDLRTVSDTAPDTATSSLRGELASVLRILRGGSSQL
jgi:DNA-binding transcriptional MerR regulator